MFGHDEIKKLIAFQEKIVAEIGKEKMEVTLYEVDAELEAEVKSMCLAELKQSCSSSRKACS